MLVSLCGRKVLSQLTSILLPPKLVPSTHVCLLRAPFPAAVDGAFTSARNMPETCPCLIGRFCACAHHGTNTSVVTAYTAERRITEPKRVMGPQSKGVRRPCRTAILPRLMAPIYGPNLRIKFDEGSMTVF